MKSKLDPTLHKNGTVTYWSVYRQAWVKNARRISDDELAAMDQRTRGRIISHQASRIGKWQ